MFVCDLVSLNAFLFVMVSLHVALQTCGISVIQMWQCVNVWDAGVAMC